MDAPLRRTRASARRRADPPQTLLPRSCTRSHSTDRHSRRQHFETIVQCHVKSLASVTRPKPRPFSSPSARPPTSRMTDDHDQSPDPPTTPLLPVSAISPSVARDAIQQNGHHAISAMHALLRALQLVGNLSADSDTETPPDTPAPPSLTSFTDLAKELASDCFRKHDDDHFRLFTAASLAELLRICAPEPPFDEPTQKLVCRFFIDQLAVLASPNDPMEAVRFSLLEQLATVRSFVIISEHIDIVCDIFACFFALVRPHHPEKMHQYFTDVFVTLLHDSGPLDNRLLDAVLAPLIPAYAYSPHAVVLAEKVIVQAANSIQVSLCHLMNASIRANCTDAQSSSAAKSSAANSHRSPVKRSQKKDKQAQSSLSEHHPHFADLIIAINCFKPDVLIYVIPLFLENVRSPDASIRLGAVTILARIFTSRNDMSDYYPTLFTEFIARNLDVAIPVRQVIVPALGHLLTMRSKHADQLEAMLRDRVHDADESVRVEAIRAVGAAVDFVSDETLTRLVGRVQDKKQAVRDEALKQIVALCTTPLKRQRKQSAISADTHDSLFSEPDTDSLLQSAGDDGPTSKSFDNGDALEARFLRLSALPGILMECIVALRRIGHAIGAYAIERAIFEKICSHFGKTDSDGLAAGLRRFMLFLSQLSDPGCSIFRSLTIERSQARRKLLKIANLRLHGRLSSSNAGSCATQEDRRQWASSTPGVAESSGMSRGNIEEALSAAKSLSSLCPAAPGNTNVLEHCQTLASAVDMTVFNRIVEALDCNSRHAEVDSAALDVVARMGSKSAVGMFCSEQMFPRCQAGLFSSNCFKAVCDLAFAIGGDARDEGCHYDDEHEEQEDDPSWNLKAHLMLGIVRYFDLIGAHYEDSLTHASVNIRQLITVPIKENDWSAELVLCGLKLASEIPTPALKHLNNPAVWTVLNDLVFSVKFRRLRFASKLAKRATRLLLRMDEAGVKLTNVIDFAGRIAARLESFDGDFKTLFVPLTAMAQLAKHAPAVFKNVSLRCFDFARVLLSGALNVKILSKLRNESAVESNCPTEVSNSACEDVLQCIGRGECELLFQSILHRGRLCLAEAVCSAAKLLTYALPRVDSSEEAGNVISTLIPIVDEKKGDVFDISALDIPESDDDDASSLCVIDAVVRATNRLSAGKALLWFARQPEFLRNLSPHMMVKVMLLAQDEHPTVRIYFAQCIRKNVMKKLLPLRWTVSMALMAVDPVASNVDQVRSMITQVFQQRRLLCERARLHLSGCQTQLLPESTLADLMWVLANLPDVEIEQEAGFPESIKCIELLLECLMESKEYANVLNEYIESVSIAQDISEASSGEAVRTERLKELSRLSSLLLRKKLAGRKLDFIDHNSRVSLPADLFHVVEERRAHSSDVLKKTARRQDGGKVRDRVKEVEPTINSGAYRSGVEDSSRGNVEVMARDVGAQEERAEEMKAQEGVVQDVVEDNGHGKQRDGKPSVRGSGQMVRRGKKRRSIVEEESVGSLNAHGEGDGRENETRDKVHVLVDVVASENVSKKGKKSLEDDGIIEEPAKKKGSKGKGLKEKGLNARAAVACKKEKPRGSAVTQSRSGRDAASVKDVPLRRSGRVRRNIL